MRLAYKYLLFNVAFLLNGTLVFSQQPSVASLVCNIPTPTPFAVCPYTAFTWKITYTDYLNITKDAHGHMVLLRQGGYENSKKELEIL